MSSSWSHGLFECFYPISTCCLATWCPCVLYGKTQARRDGTPDASFCNGSCMGCCALSLCSLQGIRQTVSRSKMRRQYGIKGNGCNDCIVSWFCGCCALVQEDKQAKAQDEENGQHAAPKRQPPMTYKQPQQQ